MNPLEEKIRERVSRSMKEPRHNWLEWLARDLADDMQSVIDDAVESATTDLQSRAEKAETVADIERSNASDAEERADSAAADAEERADSAASQQRAAEEEAQELRAQCDSLREQLERSYQTIATIRKVLEQ